MSNHLEHKIVMKIFKYQIPIQEKVTMSLPYGAYILRVEDIDGMFFMWALVNPNETEKEDRHLELYKTGQEVDGTVAPEGNLNYLGFCKIFIGQELGLYIFERI